MDDHFQKPLCIITERQALEIINHLEIMLEIFSSIASLNDKELIQQFLDAKNRIHIIFSKAVLRKERGAGGKFHLVRGCEMKVCALAHKSYHLNLTSCVGVRANKPTRLPS